MTPDMIAAGLDPQQVSWEGTRERSRNDREKMPHTQEIQVGDFFFYTVRLFLPLFRLYQTPIFFDGRDVPKGSTLVHLFPFQRAGL
jgi:hypothetical protein